MSWLERLRRNGLPATALNESTSSAVAFPSAQELAAWGRGALLGITGWEAIRSRYEASHYAVARADPAAYCEQLRTIAATGRDWAQYGAGCCATNLLDYPEEPTFTALMLDGLDVLRRRRIPMNYLSPGEREWWLQHRRTEDPWLPPQVVPTEQEFLAREPESGEALLVADMGPANYDNKIYIRRIDAGFESLIRSPGEDPGSQWHAAPTLYRLYRSLGESLSNNPAVWVDASVRPFLAEDVPDLSE